MEEKASIRPFDSENGYRELCKSRYKKEVELRKERIKIIDAIDTIVIYLQKYIENGRKDKITQYEGDMAITCERERERIHELSVALTNMWERVDEEMYHEMYEEMPF